MQAPILLPYSPHDDRNISEYIHKLQDLINMIHVGDILPDRDKIIKSWIRFRPVVIQKDFRQLNLEISLWEQNSVPAKSLEIMDNRVPVERQDHKLLPVVMAGALTSPDMGPMSVRLDRESRSKGQIPAITARSVLSSSKNRNSHLQSPSPSQFQSRLLVQPLKHHNEKPLHLDENLTLY